MADPTNSACDPGTQPSESQELSKPAVTITDRAAAKVQEIMQTEGMDPASRLRVRVVGGGCSGFAYDLYFDLAEDVPTDTVLEMHGVKIVVDYMSLQYLAGTEIDYVEGLQGAGFKFNNPNVKATCGCGSSFGV